MAITAAAIARFRVEVCECLLHVCPCAFLLMSAERCRFGHGVHVELDEVAGLAVERAPLLGPHPGESRPATCSSTKQGETPSRSSGRRPSRRREVLDRGERRRAGWPRVIAFGPCSATIWLTACWKAIAACHAWAPNAVGLVRADGVEVGVELPRWCRPPRTAGTASTRRCLRRRSPPGSRMFCV